MFNNKLGLSLKMQCLCCFQTKLMFRFIPSNDSCGCTFIDVLSDILVSSMISILKSIQCDEDLKGLFKGLSVP